MGRLKAMAASFFNMQVQIAENIFSVVSPMMSFDLVQSPGLGKHVCMVADPTVVLPVAMLRPGSAVGPAGARVP